MGMLLNSLFNIDEKLLFELAGKATFERGQDYAAKGLVISITKKSDKFITAQVQGSQLYVVDLWLKGKILQYSCNCPFALEGAFCKHCVAVGMVHFKVSETDST